MSNAQTGGGSAPAGTPAKVGLWRFLGNAAFLGALGTVLVGLLQYVSAYHDSVTKLAKEDLDAATSALTETVTALSNPLSLQERLIWNFYVAKKNNTYSDDEAYETRSARSIHQGYEDSFTALTTNINLLARKIEIYLDLPGDLNHAAASNSSAKVEPISAASLRASAFGCDKDLPVFGKDNSGKDLSIVPLALKADSYNDSNKPPTIDWKSARDNLLTLGYCFEFTHERMGGIRQWAANKPSKPIDVDIDNLKTLSKIQVQRLNNFMSVATFKIEQFRVRYQPNGILCTILGIDTAFDHFTHVCTPHLVATQ